MLFISTSGTHENEKRKDELTKQYDNVATIQLVLLNTTCARLPAADTFSTWAKVRGSPVRVPPVRLHEAELVAVVVVELGVVGLPIRQHGW